LGSPGRLGASLLRRRDGNYLVGTQIQSLRMLGPLDGVLTSVSYWPSFVFFLSLAQFALGDADPAVRFCLRTLSVSQTHVRPVLGMVSTSCFTVKA
jgi:hypothetical protein